MKNRQRGKRNEKSLEKYLKEQGFKCRRLGILGKEDLELIHEGVVFLIEAKTRKRFVAKEWYEQIKKHCKNGEIGMVIVHSPYERRENDLLILTLGNWIKQWEIIANNHKILEDK